MSSRKPDKKPQTRRKVTANQVNLFNAFLWGTGGVLYLIATNYFESGIFTVFGYLFLLMAAMYAARYLNHR